MSNYFKLFNTIIGFFFLSNLFSQNVVISDGNFKNYLISNPAINTNSDSEIQISEAASFNDSINISNLSITNLTGIEYFTALKVLDCSINQLTDLDLSNNTALIALNCENCNLNNLNISTNSNLLRLNCMFNNLSILNISNNPHLRALNCGANQLNSLDLQSNIELSILDCTQNSINDLNVTYNLNLVSLRCQSNGISTLDISGNIALESLDCWYNNLYNLDISSNPNLKYLVIGGNHLNNINVTLNTLLTHLDCSGNNLTLLNLSNNSELEFLSCGWNPYLSNLNLSSNIKLGRLECQWTNMQSLDLRLNSELYYLNCFHSHLTSLNLKNGNNHNMDAWSFESSSNQLTCIEVDDVNYSLANWTDNGTYNSSTDSFTQFSTDCSTLSLENIDQKDIISIYPNPVSNQLSIKRNNQIFSDQKVQITNTSGQILFENNHFLEDTIETKNLEDGVYFLKYSEGENNSILKFIVNHN